MRQFMIAFVCLSTIAIAQNAVVATPIPAVPEVTIRASTTPNPDQFVSSAVFHRGGAPEPATMVLLVAGLSGLCAVGGRQHDRRKRQSV